MFLKGRSDIVWFALFLYIPSHLTLYARNNQNSSFTDIFPIQRAVRFKNVATESLSHWVSGLSQSEWINSIIHSGNKSFSEQIIQSHLWGESTDSLKTTDLEDLDSICVGLLYNNNTNNKGWIYKVHSNCSLIHLY